MRKIFLIILGALALLSCQKQSNPLSVETEVPAFVKNIGAIYQYAVTDTTLFIFHADSLQISNDTATVAIIGYTVLPDGRKAFIWQRTFKGETDSILVTVSRDSVFFESRNGYFASDLALVFPLQNGKSWKYSFFDFSVAALKRLRVPAGTFKNVFAVKQVVKRIGNTFGYNEYFIDPQVGILKFLSRISSTMGETNHRIKWELINYVTIME